MKAFGYCRVSSEMQMEGFSIAAQERAIRTYCELQGWELEHVYVDEGRSARSDDTSKRPEFARMLADAEAHKADVVVVHKLDRFARNIVTTLTTLQRLEKSGIGFVSINENMDFTSPIGKAMLAMLAAFAQFYSDNLSAETKKGKAERKKQGLFNGTLPFGTTRNAQGIPAPDRKPWACSIAQKADIVPYDGLVLAFEMAANGASDRDIARRLNRLGHMSSGNWGRNPMSKDSVRVILRNRFYLGELPDDNGGWIPGQHKPMIDEDLFARALQWRARRASGRDGRKSGARVTPFTGLLVCGECGSPMRKQSGTYYRCSRTLQTQACSEPGVSTEALEAQVVDMLQSFAFQKGDRPLLERLIKEWVSERTPTQQEQQDASGRLRRLKELFLDNAITIEEYRDESKRLEAMAEASKVYEVATTAERVSQVLQDLSILANGWMDQNPGQQNQTLGALFSAIYVQNKRVAAVLPRPESAVVLAPILRVPTAHRRKRRASIQRPRGIPEAAMLIPTAYFSAKSRYQAPRPRKLTNAQIAMIRMRADEPLRDLADEFGVSYETIRKYRQ